MSVVRLEISELRNNIALIPINLCPYASASLPAKTTCRGMTMHLEMIGWMTGFSLKLIFNPENIVTASNFELFSDDRALADLAIVTPTRTG